MVKNNKAMKTKVAPIKNIPNKCNSKRDQPQLPVESNGLEELPQKFNDQNLHK